MIRPLLLALLLTACSPDPALRVAYAIDGDSMKLSDGSILRLEGIDSPEIRGKCPAEIDLAKRARNFAHVAVTERPTKIILSGKREKFGRVLGRIEVEGFDLGDLLIRAGLARAYDGRHARQGWC